MRSAAVLTCNSVIGGGGSVRKESAHVASLQPACRTMYGGGALPNELLIKCLYTRARRCV